MYNLFLSIRISKSDLNVRGYEWSEDIAENLALDSYQV